MPTSVAIHPTNINGLLVIDLPLFADDRGWFKENWQREKMLTLGLPDFGPVVQNNMSFNTARGATRGIHAEPWDKYIGLGTGRIFGAWVDLREGSITYGQTYTHELGPESAVFVPRGVGNSYQALEDGTLYSYLVNEHWSAELKSQYTFVNLGDPALAIPWPIPLAQAEVSDADKAHPLLADVTPMAPRKTIIIGAGGQLGLALQAVLPSAVALTQEQLDLRYPDQIAAIDWASVGTVINAAAYTAVDAAETPEGRRDCWDVNVTALGHLVEVCRTHRITLVHISSDYVFDGTIPEHDEDESFSPLGVYGQTKASGDALVATLPRHYIARTSWVIGQGNNFVRTMAGLAERGVQPAVVDDQLGRLTFTSDLAAAIVHLLASQAPYGTYNVTNSGPVTSWYELACDVFALTGHDAVAVSPTTTDAYTADKPGTALRPRHSTLSLAKLEATGFHMPDAGLRLREYLAGSAE
ncbi:MAG: sugar nucleotide-binding protein [Propionibacteriaceae bacterium]|jgi:dTDP-4-dehydrorhamnose 3,5-epimerase|nr:sugar nucleotide-binding protein [Propionibacteriaceae bacterium]